MISKIILLAGLASWFIAIYTATHAIDILTIFLLVLGGQLMKFGYLCMETKEEAEWRNALADVLEQIDKAVRK